MNQEHLNRGESTRFLLSHDEQNRYSRQLAIPEFGLQGQEKLKRARVAVIGAGGLGAPLLQYLAAAGVGHIGIFDYDCVELSNLHRQVLYGTDDVGREKVSVASDEVRRRNPDCDIRPFSVRLTDENAREYLSSYDVVADATDNFTARYVIDDATALLGIPLVSGALFRFEGQLSVFNYRDGKGCQGPRYRDLFPQKPAVGAVPNCAESGVLGVVPGVIGSLQAAEVIKVITGVGDVLSSKLLLFDLLSMQSHLVNITWNPRDRRAPDESEASKTVDGCSVAAGTAGSDRGAGEADSCEKGGENGIEGAIMAIPELTPEEVNELRAKGETIHLVDVRSQEERDRFHIGGIHIPSGYLETRREQLPPGNRVLLYCQSGFRSGEAARMLRNRYGYSHIYSLGGGLGGWKERRQAAETG